MSTIVAISTAPGNAGIGIIRMSGEKSFEIIQKIFCPTKEENIKGYTMKHGTIIDNQQEIVDEVLVSFFVAPKSYTGENMCEINSHGNLVVLNKILQICIENGAILAEPGEFTKRAFLNGRIDLLQAEAVMDLIHSKSEMERKAAVQGLEGELSQKIKKIKMKLLDVLSDIEVSIDYPEYDMEERTENNLLFELETAKNELTILEKSFDRGKLLRDGVRVAIIGRPNVGKSSLLNKFLKEERAIVTDIEGTTRDTIEEFVQIQGIPFKMIDTAGIRNAENEIEKIGIDKSKKALREADLIIAIFDQTKELNKEDLEILNTIQNRNAIVLLNKIDLNDSKIDFKEIEPYCKNILEISIHLEKGMEALYHKMVTMFQENQMETENGSVITNIRHKELIKKSKESIIEAIKVISEKMPVDIMAIYLKEAVEFLNQITGENVTEDILQTIFSKFCLGK